MLLVYRLSSLVVTLRATTKPQASCFCFCLPLLPHHNRRPQRRGHSRSHTQRTHKAADERTTRSELGAETTNNNNNNNNTNWFSVFCFLFSATFLLIFFPGFTKRTTVLRKKIFFSGEACCYSLSRYSLLFSQRHTHSHIHTRAHRSVIHNESRAPRPTRFPELGSTVRGSAVLSPLFRFISIKFSGSSSISSFSLGACGCGRTPVFSALFFFETKKTKLNWAAGWRSPSVKLLLQQVDGLWLSAQL